MIEVRGLKKRLGHKQVLDGLDLDVEQGETVVVLGPSGTGKSVLLKHMIGLMQPDAGSIRVAGEEIVGMDEPGLDRVRLKFGMLFQGAALFDSMTVGENVALGLTEHSSVPPAEIRRRVTERLGWVGLKDVEQMKPASLSGGMGKRVGLARALAMDPEIILYDEPTTGLDPITGDVINQLIRALQHQLGVTSVVVTHDLMSAYKVGDRLAMLYQGRVVFIGTPDEVRETDHPMVRHGLIGLINQEKDLMCCGEAGTVGETLAATAKNKPDLVILDLRLKDGDGLELIKSLKSQLPELRILILSQYEAPIYIERALRAGALGYLSKDQAAADVLRAVRTVVAGQVFLSAGTAALLLHKFVGPARKTSGTAATDLTDRELHVLQLLGAGMSTRKIAVELKLSFKTIETHRENIKHKLGLKDAAELLHFAGDWVRNEGFLPQQKPGSRRQEDAEQGEELRPE